MDGMIKGTRMLGLPMKGKRQIVTQHQRVIFAIRQPSLPDATKAFDKMHCGNYTRSISFKDLAANLKKRPIYKSLDFVPQSNLWWGQHFEGLADERCRLGNLQIWFWSVGLLGQSRLCNHSPAG